LFPSTIQLLRCSPPASPSDGVHRPRTHRVSQHVSRPYCPRQGSIRHDPCIRSVGRTAGVSRVRREGHQPILSTISIDSRWVWQNPNTGYPQDSGIRF